MAASPDTQNALAAATQPKCVLYVGSDPALVGAALAPLGDTVALKHEPQVAGALIAAAQLRVHAVIIDLAVPDESRKLLIAALAGAHHRPRIIVLARRDAVTPLLRLPGVYSVVTYPLLPAQIRAAVADRRSKPRNNEPPREPPAATAAAPSSEHEAVPTRVTAALASPEAQAKHKAWPGFRLYFLTANRFMSVVSNLYKNAAFVLLASLFAAFCFYGFLIAYFLLASSWGAPMTLTRGHELVEKASGTISEIQVAITATKQRLSEAELEAQSARGTYKDAETLVQFMKGTVSTEIVSRNDQKQTAERQADRVSKVLDQYRKQEPEVKRSSPQQLYEKRLITKKAYEYQTGGSIEADQRISDLENSLDMLRGEVQRLTGSINLLHVLQRKLDTGAAGEVTAGSAELMLLTKEAVDARSSLEQAEKQLESATARQDLLRANATALEARLAEIQHSAVGRAIDSRVDVIFVPYGNEKRFTAGTPLYTCALTVVFCHRAGVIGETLPGESTAVHPFFGKPMRGYFVEAKLSDPEAASEEIIHAGRPPFFF